MLRTLPVVIDVRAGPSDPDCPYGHTLVSCPYDCSDGVDNDGDGYVDYPADPSCGSANADDESVCIQRSAHAQIWSDYPDYIPTVVDVHASWVHACPGAPNLQSSHECWVSNNWDETAGCPAWNPYADTAGGEGTFTCLWACVGQTSPHNLGAAVVLVGGLDFTCSFKATSGVPYQTYCQA